MTAIANNQTDEEIILPKNYVLGRYWKTRIFSFIALSGLVSSCGYLGREGYYVVSDNWVAPTILGPDNDLVLEQRLKLAELLLEKGRAQSETDAVEGDLDADDKALTRLNELKSFASNALNFSTTATSQQVHTGNADIQTLANQELTLKQMIQRQETIVNDAKKNLSAGLISQPDLDREQQTFDQLQVADMENERSRMQSNLLLSQASMANHSLFTRDGRIPTQEMTLQAQMIVQVECETLTIEADKRTKLAEKKRVRDELFKINNLESDLNTRPIFRAIEQNQDLAFAPYASLQGIIPGNKVMDCFWYMFNCKEVGRVSNVIPGETILPDIFTGGQVRGQFITLSLNASDHASSMQSKILRIR